MKMTSLTSSSILEAIEYTILKKYTNSTTSEKDYFPA